MVGNITDIALEVIGLFRSDYLAHFHVREMAKLIDKSHVTLLPHLNALDEAAILTSKSVGKNKVYSLNMENIITKHYLALSEIATTTSFLGEVFLIKRLTTQIHRLDTTGTIILFGSYAKRSFDDESDIDLFLLGPVDDEALRPIKEVGRTYAKSINSKRSTMKSFAAGLRRGDPLIMEIIKNHIILENPAPFINSLWRYHDERR